MAALGASTIIQSIGSLVSGVAGFMAAQSQAAVMRMNAQISQDNARRSIERSQIEQVNQDIQTRAMLGEQLAAQSASGIDVGAGSAMRTRLSARELGRLDALNVRQAGELEAFDHKASAASLRAQASGTSAQGAFGLLGSFLNAGSIITSAKPVARKNYFAPVPVEKPRLLNYG